MTAHESPPCPGPSTPPSHDGTGTADVVRVTEPEVMTTNEVAAYLRLNRKTVFEYAARGVIPHRRVGKRLLFLRSALVGWLSCKCSPTTGATP